MKPLGDQNRHYWLVQGMAKTTGVDLARASEQGDLDQSEWADTVRECRACDWADGCHTWLRGTQNVDVPPPQCRNRARLAMLRVEQELER